jgi:hypothetical protein
VRRQAIIEKQGAKIDHEAGNPECQIKSGQEEPQYELEVHAHGREVEVRVRWQQTGGKGLTCRSVAEFEWTSTKIPHERAGPQSFPLMKLQKHE